MSAVDITPMTAGRRSPSTATCRGTRQGTVLRHRRAASGTIDEVTGLVRDLRQGKGSAGKLVTATGCTTTCKQFVATAGQMTREIQQGRGTVGKLLKDPKAAESLEASMKNIEDMTRSSTPAKQPRCPAKDEAFAKSLERRHRQLPKR